MGCTVELSESKCGTVISVSEL